MGGMIQYKRPDGKEAQGYLAEPAAKNAPGIVVIQEWWGLTDQIQAVCERYAKAGYRALAPDIYEGKLTAKEEEAAKLMGATNFVEAAEQYVGGAVDFLKRSSPKAAVSGFCMGGAITVIAAVKLKNADAAVCFYGIPPEKVAHPKDVRVPFQGHFAEIDGWCTPKAVDQLEAGLKAGGVKYELHRYAGCQHAFFNETRPNVYDKTAADKAWERTLAFLKKHIG